MDSSVVMLTYIWCSDIWPSEFGSNPFEIKVFAHNVEGARKEVFAVLDEIARQKSEYQELETEIKACLHEQSIELKSQGNTDRWPPTQRKVTDLREKQKALVAKIPANFFNGCFASGPFDYTADAELRFADETLGDFIKNTEPRCLGPVRMVSFSSCLDG
jgi:hypothetical protein